MLTIRLFAAIRDAAGQTVLEMELPSSATVSEVFRQLTLLHPDVGPFRRSLLVAVNQEYADWDGPVKDGDEIAFFPPVSGGRP